MSWFDKLKHYPYQIKADAAATARHAFVEHQQLKQQREDANQSIAALKDQTQFRGMTREQRAAEIKQITGEMPGSLAVAHAHPGLRLATAPFRIAGSIFWWAGKKGVQIAPRVTPGSNTWLIILAIMYHLAVNFGAFPTIITRSIANAVMILFIVLFIFDSSERNGDNYRTIVILALVFEIIIPYAIQHLAIFQKISFIRLYGAAYPLVVLTWFYYAVLGRGKNINTGLTKWAKLAIILFWFGMAIALILSIIPAYSDVELDSASAQGLAAAKLIYAKSLEGWKMVWNTLVSGVSNVQTIFAMRIKQATGEYYFGVVEENEKEPLGVYLENLKASQSEYEENEPVIVYATLHAKTLDDTVNVKISCYAGENQNKIQGMVYPSETFEISNLQQEDLDCTFDRLTKGDYKITYTADFNFETIGYLKRYFAERNAIAAATRQNIDLLDEYQIIDKNPVAHYTNGPVAMGIGPEQVLVGVSEDYTVKPRIAFTLDSTKGWGGVITKLNEIVLLIPEEMSLDTTQCTDKNWVEYSVDDCVESEVRYSSKTSQQCYDDEACIEEQCTAQMSGYHAYKLDVNNPSYTDIKDYITLSCRLNVDDVIGLLEATPIATHYFYVKARYDYQTSKDTSVSVVKQEETTAVEGETSLKSSSLPTFSLADSAEELQFIFYNYGEYLFKAQEKFKIPVCDIAGVIAYTSHSNPNYLEDNKKGLMGITDTLAQQYASSAGITGSFSLFDIETNINLGAAYLQYIYSIATGETRFMRYYIGINNIDQYDEKSRLYAGYVQKYSSECESLGLSQSTVTTETGADNALHEGSVPYSQLSTAQTIPLGITYNNQPFALSAVLSTVGQSRYALVHLLYNSITFESRISGYNRWDGPHDFPFIQAMDDTVAEEVKYRYITDFIVDTNSLLEDEDTEVIPDVLYLEYTGSEIRVKLANNPADKTQLSQICDVPWTEYTASQTCIDTGIADNDDNIPGLIIRNLVTDEKTIGQGYSRVQLDWSVARQMEALT